ncbi:hypothetical protein POTOM_054727 [Populus tomentosa]|uniref:Uncharacterized protein n=1 Tax=Populus tomentosa TaxID=118781 RepID=A0A8X7Y314_POPTO|nr:hypothetical protein POTOM_054727 [Populus tomentosa]
MLLYHTKATLMVHTSSHCYKQNEEIQGLVVAGGGERNGIEGIAVGIGIVGIEGMLESGGKVTLGTEGIVVLLGSGGKAIAEDDELLGHPTTTKE